MTDRGPKLSIVVPVYNERVTIGELLSRVQAVPVEKEIVIVDDYSTDGTRDFLRAVDESSRNNAAQVVLPGTGRTLRTDNIRVFFQEKNQGKGAALRRGFEVASGAIVLVQDADLEYNPHDYAALIAPIEQGLADVVYGSRFLGGPHRVLYFWHSVGNRFLTLASNMFTNLNLTDVWTCYKAFRREVLASIVLQEDRFGFEPEVTAKVAHGAWRLYEVPVSYAGRTYAEGKKITWRDAPRALWCVVRYNLFSGRGK